MKNERNKQYSLFTFVALIAGIIIGSGIYFKTGKIMSLSGGKLIYLIINFSIAAVGVIFGGIAISQFAIISKGNGGVVTYYDEHVSRGSATGFAWYQTFAYYPVISGVVSWVSVHYIFKLTTLTNLIINYLNYKNYSEKAISAIYMFIVLIFAIMLAGAFTYGNTISKTHGSRFQSLSFVVKFIPVIIILIIAIIVSASPKLNSFASKDYTKFFDKKIIEPINLTMSQSSKGFGFLGALPTVAFMYEGWIVATTIVNETKNRNKTVRNGYIIAPLIVFAFYVIYALTASNILGEKGVAYSDTDVATNSIKSLFLNNQAAHIAIDTVILAIIIISVLGVVNGVTIGGVRMPQALAEKNMLPDRNNKIKNDLTNAGLSKKSALIYFISEIFAIVIFYLIQVMTDGLIDISDLTVQFSYLFYIILYIKLIIYTKKKIVKNKFVGYVCSTLGILSSLLIFVGGFLVGSNNKNQTTIVTAILIFGMIVFIVFILGYFYSQELKNKKIIDNNIDNDKTNQNN